MNKVKSVTIHINARLSLPVSGAETDMPSSPQTCGGSCSTCPGNCRAAAEPSAQDGSHTSNSLRQAGEILLKMAAGQYPDTEEKGLWETLEALLRSYARGKGAAHE